MQTKKYTLFLSLLILLQCKYENHEKIYKTKSLVPFSKHIIKTGKIFNFPDFRDSTKVLVKNDSVIYTILKDTVYYTELKHDFKDYDLPLIEASNDEIENFLYSNYINYDLKINNKNLDVNIIYPEQYKGYYRIKLSSERIKMIYKSLLFDYSKLRILKKTDTLLFNKSQILFSINGILYINAITDENITTFYDLIKFTIKESFENKKRYRIRPFSVSTSKYFDVVRNIPYKKL